MKKIIIVLFIVTLAYSVLSADYDFRLKVGYISFNMKHLKNLQKEILQELLWDGIDAKAFDNFPSTLSYQIQYLKNSERSKLGFCFEFASTGSRLDYRDYSGKYSFDQILNRYSFGFHGEQIPFPKISHNLIQYIQVSYLLTTLEWKERLEIYEVASDNSSTTFLSHGGAVELGFSYILLKTPMLIMLDLGGCITYSQTFFLEKNYDAKLSSEKGLVSPTWAGYKVGFTVKYNLMKLLNKF